MRRILAGLLLGVVAVLTLPAAPASAHAALIRTSPVQGSVIDQAPSEVVITFSEHVTPVTNKIQVFDPSQKKIVNGTPKVSGDQLHIPVRTDVPHGTYLVTYRVISADSHPVGASFTYSVGAPSAAAPTAPDSGATSRLVSIGFNITRGIGYAGLILVAGPALVLLLLWPRRLDRRPPTRLAYLGLGLIAFSALLEVFLQAPYSTGAGLFGASSGDLRDVLGSQFGQAHLVRLAVVVVAAFLLRPYLAGRSGRAERVLLAILAVIGVLTWPLSGHPGSSTAPILTVVADAAHLTAVAVWIGGLVVLALFLLRRANRTELTAILPVWSTWATIAVSVLVLAGVTQALIEIGSVYALFHTRYSAIVALKAGVLGVVLLVATVSRKIANAPTKDNLPRLKKTVLAEVVGAVLILSLASVLVQTTPARTQAANAASQDTSGIYSVTLSTDLYQVQFDLDPAQTGDNTVHLYSYTPQGAPLKILNWTVKATLIGGSIEPVSVVFLTTDTHAFGQVNLPLAGQWRFDINLQVSQFDSRATSTTVTVK